MKPRNFQFVATFVCSMIVFGLSGTAHADILIVSDMSPDPTTLYGGNWDVTQGVGGPGGFARMMYFRSGNATSNLTKLEAYVNSDGAAPTAGIWASTGSDPDTDLPTGSPLVKFTLSSPAGPLSGGSSGVLATFTPDSTFALSPNTDYWISYQGSGQWGAAYQDPIVTGEAGATTDRSNPGVAGNSSEPLNVSHCCDHVSYLFALYRAEAGSVIPEPSAFAIGALALAGLALAGWRRRRRSA